MARFALLAVPAFFVSTLHAATIRTTATCTAFTATVSNISAGPGSCYSSMYSQEPGDSNYLIVATGATTAASVGISTDGLTLSSDIQMNVTDNGDFRASAGTSTVNTTLADRFTTAGPERQGYVVPSITGLAWDISSGQSTANTTVRLGNLSGGCIAPGFCSFPNNGRLIGPGTQTEYVPFTLGTPFDFAESMTLFNTFDSGSFITTDLQFNFFEADGATPVQILDASDMPCTDAPEPASLAMVGLSPFVLLGPALRRSRRQD